MQAAWRMGAQRRAEAVKQAIPLTSPDYDRTRVTERPDGFYWEEQGGGRQYGPFPTLIEAVQDMQAADDLGPEPPESLREAEADIGIAEWVDPETGEPAEEQRPRIEDQ